ncbi:cobyric acid synthase [Kineosporia sp. A_224]|uniref:cobyric acid synthase n=1 Tax=Kineosporia sp. A_224 TaxID=1962180 RepID=UPI000B4AF622|nr:cobyric acid synthase [Kineosporia sp. A_224]
MNGTLLVAGTTSDAGKSVVTAGICRWLHRRGVRVAPFKAQNMSNNSAVTADGAEIGRAQAAQAAACGLPPEAAMNPVLLKPGSDRESHVVLMGRPYGTAGAASYRGLREVLRRTALDAFDDLRSRFDVVVCEGAGSPAEINLREGDIANMGLADARDVPTIVVGDIDRGGVFAAMFGTLALLSPRDQSLVAGFVVNKFRGDPALLEPGLRMLDRLTGRPTLGVLPWTPGLAFDLEDSLSLDTSAADPAAAGPAVGAHTLRVAAVRLPRTSNSTDVEALAVEPGVVVRWTTSPDDVRDADLVVLPGSRATVADLAWLRSSGVAAAVADRAARGRPLLGVCGGYQMLARSITDDVESRAGTVAGLGLLPVDVRFAAAKVVGRPVGEAYGEPVTTAYEIHHGIGTVDPAALRQGAEVFLDGCRAGAVWGTTWHGAWESDGFRRAFLADVADRAGREFVPAPGTSLAAVRAARLDVLGDLVADHLDTAALERLVDGGAPAGLPFVPPGAPA